MAPKRRKLGRTCCGCGRDVGGSSAVVQEEADRLQASIAAFLCLKTRARSESGTNPLIRLELPTLLHQHVALVSGANSFVQYIARWSSPFAKSCAMTDSMAMDLSTGVGQHRHIKGSLAFAYGSWTVADACSPASARFCTYGFAGAPP